MAVYRYEFDESVSFDEALETLTLSRIAVASALGESRLRLETNVLITKAQRSVEISAATEAGNMLNRVFTGYLARQLPTGSFNVTALSDAAALGACA